MIRFKLFILLFIIAISGFSEELSISNIPANLKKNADAILRYSNTEYYINSCVNIKKHVHFAITIMNKSAAKKAVLIIPYDGKSNISTISGSIYDYSGKKIRKLKRDQIKDQAYTNDYTLIGDSRLKRADFRYTHYPYTVEFEYNVEYKGKLGYTPWIPRNEFYYAVQNAELSIHIKNPSLIRIKQLNDDNIQFSKSKDKEVVVYRWSITNISALAYEKNAPDFMQFSPTVLIAPNEFWYRKTKGRMNNWAHYGMWLNSLLKDRDQLEPETITAIKKLTDTIPDIKQKIKAVYKYVQHKNRYVNISLGIGGFQPEKAKKVDENSYGDCKALSNYTKALLKAIGIKSYYSEIGNGLELDSLYDQFASTHKTNHAILMVPLKSDTTWLECTSNYYPTGFIGKGNVNRKALVVIENEGKLVKTPRFDEKDNLCNTLTTVSMDSSMKAVIIKQSTYTGLQYSFISSLKQYSKKDQIEYLMKHIKVPALAINRYSIDCSKNDIPEVQFQINITSKQLVTKSGKRYFLPINPLNRTSNPYHKKVRKTDIYYELAYTDMDTTWLEIPSNFKIEYIPENVSYKCIVGEYGMTSKIIGTKVCSVRKMIIKRGIFPNKDYAEIAEFYQKVSKADRRKIIYSEK